MMLSLKKYVFLAAALIVLSLTLSSCLPSTPPPPCTTDFLIWSINNANGNGPGTDTINLDPGCVYQLGVVDNTIDGNNGLPSITTSIIINGNGATVRRSTQSQKAAIRLFHVSQGGELTLNDIRLYDGLGMEPPDVTLPLRNDGGAIFNAGVLTINNSDLDYNRAYNSGGGIYNAGTMTINATTFQNNGVNIGGGPGESGGAIFNTSTGIATITDSTFVGNIASQSGAGITNGGIMTITNSTISGNSTTLSGLASGAAIMNSGNLHISYTTIAANVGTTSGAVWSAPDTIEISNSIIAANLPQNCSYPATSMILGPNISSDETCSGMVQDDPLLGPLANYGGPTLTHSIAVSSPAKNFAFGLCPATDQRGESRPHGSACDIGSYEYNGEGSPPGGTSFISGTVFNDVNSNGIFDPGESGLTGVELQLGSGPCPALTGISSALSMGTDGNFDFEISPPTAGSYCISIDPLVPPNVNILIPGGFTTPPAGQFDFTITEGQDLTDLDFGWQFQFDNIGNPLMEITTVHLDSTTIPVNTFMDVEVTVTNIGPGSATGFELVLFSQYGDGPPNPAGYELLPEMAPGASHTVLFSPGVMYSSGGYYTLRTLVTDSWYTLGDPDHIGLYGDYEDTPITVTEFACPQFDLEPIDLVFLNLPGDTRVLPLYVKFNGPLPMDPPYEFQAYLGELESYQCGLQGFDDRLFCMTHIPEGQDGTEVPFILTLSDCPEPIYELPAVQIPVPKPVSPSCSADLGERDCVAAGGTYHKLNDRTSTCICP